ncbi:DNA cytosine methyltransferase [Haloferax volcanii]|uniref:DNA cytosine methyltransferase n=1 Tax=Haloferax volcanii TaxID=2246 RepID=UPI00349F997D
MSNFKFIDLFSGIGGTRAAYEGVGGECVFSCEINEDAQEVYKANWDDPIHENDIRNVDSDAVPDHDLLLACWPCPSFSQMGKLDGLEDERGMLFYHIVQLLKEKKPKAFMLENVKNLRFVKGGEAYRTVKNALEKCGYTVFDEVLNALNFGLPQHRERLIVVGIRNDIAPDKDKFSLPTENRAKLETDEEKREALAAILEDNPDKRYFASEKVQKDRIEAVTDAEGIDDAENIPEPSVWHENRNGKVTPRPYCGTLRASSSWHYLLINGKRNPTVRELLRLQGFPEWFKIDDSNRSRARRLTGNTIPVPMVHTVAKALVNEIDLGSTRKQSKPVETATSE